MWLAGSLSWTEALAFLLKATTAVGDSMPRRQCRIEGRYYEKTLLLSENLNLSGMFFRVAEQQGQAHKPRGQDPAGAEQDHNN